MSKSIPALFTKSLIAAAVVSLSACSTTSSDKDYDLSRVGEGIMTAGRTTADVSERAWDKTTYLLGFSDEETPSSPSDTDLLPNANDVALQENTTAPSRDTTVRPIAIRNAARAPQEQTPTNSRSMSSIQDQTPTNVNRPPPSQQDATIESPNAGSTTTSQDAAPDLMHKVASDETLWDIAKKTTGDATNWHLLADVNNLGPNASVYPGQQLIIPAAMADPAYGSVATAEAAIDTQESAAQPYVDTQNFGNSSNYQTPLETADADAAATTDYAAVGVADDQQPSGQPFKVQAGETLWNFAKRTTGDATNWEIIAEENNFSDSQASYIRMGQTIYVPEHLVEPITDSASLDSQSTATVEEQNSALENQASSTVPAESRIDVAENSNSEIEGSSPDLASAIPDVAVDSNAINASSALLAEASSSSEDNQAIEIVEATYKAESTPKPIDIEQSEEPTIATPSSQSLSPEEIMVSGTYYPKAVYNDADFSSSLLMRVSPGTTLTVSKIMGTWYQVKTEKGLGYVHQRDIK